MYVEHWTVNVCKKKKKKDVFAVKLDLILSILRPTVSEPVALVTEADTWMKKQTRRDYEHKLIPNWTGVSLNMRYVLPTRVVHF